MRHELELPQLEQEEHDVLDLWHAEFEEAVLHLEGHFLQDLFEKRLELLFFAHHLQHQRIDLTLIGNFRDGLHQIPFNAQV